MAKKVTIGQTTALIPEAGSAIKDEWIIDGESGNTNFPYADFKALATVGEVGPKSRLALTGYPDGNAAWLKDDDTVRVVYQSESYGTLGSSYDPETWPHELESGVTFTGSKVHYIDYDRTAFADFMSSGIVASEMVKDSGILYDKAYNLFGEKVTTKNTDPADLVAKWGNQTTPAGTVIEFENPLSEADFFPFILRC